MRKGVIFNILAAAIPDAAQLAAAAIIVGVMSEVFFLKKSQAFITFLEVLTIVSHALHQNNTLESSSKTGNPSVPADQQQAAAASSSLSLGRATGNEIIVRHRLRTSSR